MWHGRPRSDKIVTGATIPPPPPTPPPPPFSLPPLPLPVLSTSPVACQAAETRKAPGARSWVKDAEVFCGQAGKSDIALTTAVDQGDEDGEDEGDEGDGKDDEEDDEDDGGEEGCMGEDGIDVFCTASTVRRRSAWIPSSAPISSRPEKEGEEGGIMCCMCLLERCVY